MKRLTLYKFLSLYNTCNSSNFFLVQAYSINNNMSKFKTNQFPTVSTPFKKRKRSLLKDGRLVIPPSTKDDESGAGLSKVRLPRVILLRSNQKKVFEYQQITDAKKASTQKKNKQVQLPDLEYPEYGVFTPMFVGKSGQPLLNFDQPSLDLKSACNVMDFIFTNVDVTTLVDKYDADQEDFYANIMYQICLPSCPLV